MGLAGHGPSYCLGLDLGGPSFGLGWAWAGLGSAWAWAWAAGAARAWASEWVWLGPLGRRERRRQSRAGPIYEGGEAEDVIFGSGVWWLTFEGWWRGHRAVICLVD